MLPFIVLIAVFALVESPEGVLERRYADWRELGLVKLMNHSVNSAVDELNVLFIINLKYVYAFVVVEYAVVAPVAEDTDDVTV